MPVVLIQYSLVSVCFCGAPVPRCHSRARFAVGVSGVRPGWKSTKLGWRKFRRHISEFIATLAEFSLVIILVDWRHSASVGRMKILQR